MDNVLCGGVRMFGNSNQQGKHSMKSSFLLATTIVALTGCASGYPATYNSIPQGATLVCGNSVKGITPYTGYTSADVLEKLAALKREQEKTFEEAGAKGVPEYLIQDAKEKAAALGCRAVWTSGATALYDPVDADTAKAHPKGIVLLVNHPGDANTRIDDARSVQFQQPPLQQQQVQPHQQPVPVFQPQPLPAMPPTSSPNAPGRTTTVCRTLSNGTIVCD